MAQQVQEIMTHDPVTVDLSSSLVDVARRMRDEDIGDVVVTEDSEIRGIVTDRDIVVRAVADGRHPEEVRASEVLSENLVTVDPQDTVDTAADLIREHDLRRLPVVHRGRPVGFVSLGDLAVERDPDSTLADVSAATPNR